MTKRQMEAAREAIYFFRNRWCGWDAHVYLEVDEEGVTTRIYDPTGKTLLGGGRVTSQELVEAWNVREG